jgi:hypothetical protein
MQKRLVNIRHIENESRQPIITLAVVKEPDGSVGQGIAICSKDQEGGFDQEFGEDLTLGRAFKALEEKRNDRRVVRERATNRLKEVKILYEYKSIYIPSVGVV